MFYTEGWKRDEAPLNFCVYIILEYLFCRLSKFEPISSLEFYTLPCVEPHTQHIIINCSNAAINFL